MNIYFTDYFDVDPYKTGAAWCISILSLVNDLPLFIDPFLLFGSSSEKYQELHTGILKYLTFLKQKSEEGITSFAQIKSWYLFPEVKQSWLGYSQSWQ